MSTRNINVNRYEDEYVMFGKALPYIAMAAGGAAALLFAFLIRVGIWANVEWNDGSALESTKLITWVILISVVLLTALGYKLFRSRDKIHFYISWHVVVTSLLVHAWFLLAMWEDMGEWMFGVPTFSAYLIGGAVIGLSWCIRRWAYRGDEIINEEQNLFSTIGLGNYTAARKDSGVKTDSGFKFILDLDHTKTIEDAKKKLAEIAHLLGKPRSQVHVSETESGIEGEVEVTVLDKNPFNDKKHWMGPTHPGESIVLPIDFATYDTNQRGMIYLAGKNGASSEHFLTMGMPGTGKSKVWQAIYGTVLSRKEVSVVYGDPAKGMQTGGPLASGLDWFAWTEEDCQKQIKAVMNAIPERTNYLTSKGLSHWQSGCGLNFLVFHLEEAARFAEVSDLIVLLEAARSAGIAVVISLQRASHDRIPTSARYNLGGNLCFGVKGKRDAEFGLSEYARESGASPHLWQNRFPGRFYLESTGIDQRLAGHPLQADWIEEGRLEQSVDEAITIRTPMDQTTAAALGDAYAKYRRDVEQGTTAWQDMRKNRNFRVDTKDWPVDADTQVLSLDDIAAIDLTPAVSGAKANNLMTDPEETRRAIEEFEEILREWSAAGKLTFSNKEMQEVFTIRSSAWISKRLALMAREGKLVKTPEKFWRIVSL